MSEPVSPKDLLPVLSSLAAWFQDRKIPYAIIGGTAVGFLAQPRATQDVDAVVWLDLSSAREFLNAARRFGFLPRISDPIDFALKSRVLLIRHVASMIDVDISLGALPFEQEMIERAIEFTTTEVTLKVASPEDLIISKAVAQ